MHYDPVVTDDAELTRMNEVVTKLAWRIGPRLSIHDFRMVKGLGHTNLILDLVFPYDLLGERETVGRRLDEAIRQQDPIYYTVISFDRDYTEVG